MKRTNFSCYLAISIIGFLGCASIPNGVTQNGAHQRSSAQQDERVPSSIKLGFVDDEDSCANYAAALRRGGINFSPHLVSPDCARRINEGYYDQPVQPAAPPIRRVSFATLKSKWGNGTAPTREELRGTWVLGAIAIRPECYKLLGQNEAIQQNALFRPQGVVWADGLHYFGFTESAEGQMAEQSFSVKGSAVEMRDIYPAREAQPQFYPVMKTDDASEIVTFATSCRLVAGQKDTMICASHVRLDRGNSAELNAAACEAVPYGDLRYLTRSGHQAVE